MSVLTVAALAAAKKLPEVFLREQGLRDGRGVEMPYLDQEGRELFTRCRLSLDGKVRFRQPKGVELKPYGLWRLSEAREKEYAIAVEGESDSWTCWYHGYPCFGLPGASSAGRIERQHLEGIRQLFVWKEPDPGGEAFVRGIARRLAEIGFTGEAYTVAIPGVKDISDLHIECADEPEAFEAMLQGALDHAELFSPSAADHRPVGFRTIREYLDDVKTRSEKKAYFERMMREGDVSLVVGRALSGKSTFACTLARALTLGVPLLGRQCLRTRVGYMALERNGITVARLFEKWGLVDEIYFLDELPAMPLPELAKFLEKEIVDHGLELVIVDHLQNLAKIKDSKDYSMVSIAMEPIAAVAKRTNSHICLLHHQGKTNREDVIDVMGSEAYRAGADALIEAKKIATEYFIRAEVRGEGDLPKTRIKIDLSTGEVDSEDAHEAELGDARATILKYLNDRTEALTVAAIQEGVELKRALVLDAVAELIKAGKLARAGAGRKGDPYLYSVPDSVPAAVVYTREQNPENATKPNGESDLFCSRESGNRIDFLGTESDGTADSKEKTDSQDNGAPRPVPELGTAGTPGTAGTESGDSKDRARIEEEAEIDRLAAADAVDAEEL